MFHQVLLGNKANVSPLSDRCWLPAGNTLLANSCVSVVLCAWQFYCTLGLSKNCNVICGLTSHIFQWHITLSTRKEKPYNGTHKFSLLKEWNILLFIVNRIAIFGMVWNIANLWILCAWWIWDSGANRGIQSTVYF